MSRIGKRAIPVPAGVDVQIDPTNTVVVKGPKGQLTQQFHRDLKLVRENGSLLVERTGDDREQRALHGLTRTLLANMITGVTTGFTKELEIQGVGYRASMDGRTLVLSVGYSHPVRVQPMDGISFSLDGQNKVIVSGIDKQVVGEQAAQIRRVRKPEPYKGKGIRYAGEYVRRKAGKAGKGR